MISNAISIEKAAKAFGDFIAVNGINLEIRKGEIFGMLGPNGAGKTTTINMILGLLKPDSGKITVDGINMVKNPNEGKQHIGIVNQETIVEPELTAEQNILLFGRLYHVDEKTLEKRVDELLGLAELMDFKYKYAGTFSGGMQRRLAIVKSMVHKPDILLLDEPTTGLDIQNRVKLWELLKQINERDKITVLLTTQYLEEADALCNRIAIIDHGNVIASGTPAQLKQSMGKGSIIEVSVERDTMQEADKALRDAGFETKALGNKITVTVSGESMKKLDKIMKLFELKGISIESISMHEPTLDDVFLKLTGKSMRDAATENTSGRAAAVARKGGFM